MTSSPPKPMAVCVSLTIYAVADVTEGYVGRWLIALAYILTDSGVKVSSALMRSLGKGGALNSKKLELPGSCFLNSKLRQTHNNRKLSLPTAHQAQSLANPSP